jgi:hypothetical protein
MNFFKHFWNLDFVSELLCENGRKALKPREHQPSTLGILKAMSEEGIFAPCFSNIAYWVI